MMHGQKNIKIRTVFHIKSFLRISRCTTIMHVKRYLPFDDTSNRRHPATDSQVRQSWRPASPLLPTTGKVFVPRSYY